MYIKVCAIACLINPKFLVNLRATSCLNFNGKEAIREIVLLCILVDSGDIGTSFVSIGGPNHLQLDTPNEQ